jgi:hypothetical protein
MAAELTPLDIRQLPELAAVVEEVRTTRKRRRILRGEEEIAVLVPTTPKRPRPPRTRTAGASITEQTAGIFRQYRLASPLTPRQERDAFEQGVAEEVSGTRGD